MPASSSHVSGTASPSKPKAMTPSTFAQHSKGTPIASALEDDTGGNVKSSSPANGHGGFHDNGGSDPNTPRLPPTRNGSNDLDNIPQEAVTSLDNSNMFSSSVSLTSIDSRSHHSPLSAAPKSTFSSSISEPGSRDFVASKVLPFRTFEGQDQTKIASWLEESQLVLQAPFIKHTTLPHTPHTYTPQSLGNSLTSGTMEKEAGHTSNGADRSAREEAFEDGRNRSSSRSSQSRVEKRIEATLTDAEPSSQARTRKSSHTLGLFKETTASQNTQRGQNRPRTNSENAIDPAIAAGTLSEQFVAKRGQQGQLTLDGKRRDSQGTKERLSALKEDGDDIPREIDDSENSRIALGPTPIPSSSAEFASKRRSDTDVIVNESKPKASPRSHKASDASKQSVPPRLLEEIRNYHNLTAPFRERFRSTQLKSASPSLSAVEDAPHAEQEDSNDLTEPEAIGEEIEDEESEQISSILYNPHQAPSPDALEDVSIDDARKIKERSTELETKLPEPALSPVNQNDSVDDVNIALQIHNKNRYFHGDLTKARPSSIESEKKQASESGFSSASESDYESQDENMLFDSQEDSSLTDDAEATPKASPNTRKSYLSSRYRKKRHGPAAPLGAVELKPFNHQVGGHTHLFRFSKKTVCKQLTKGENIFYEVVEREHPELLKFLPK